MSDPTTPRSPHVGPSDWVTMSVEDYSRSVERARVLKLMLAHDPSDIDARVDLGNLRRHGFDVPDADAEWVLGFDPAQLAAMPAREPGAEARADEGSGETAFELESRFATDDEWSESILEEALGFISVGLSARALPLLEIVLHMQPNNDVARSWLFALKADTDGERPSPDATLRVQLPR